MGLAEHPQVTPLASDMELGGWWGLLRRRPQDSGLPGTGCVAIGPVQQRK
jgi:hypothetical protein